MGKMKQERYVWKCQPMTDAAEYLYDDMFDNVADVAISEIRDNVEHLFGEGKRLVDVSDDCFEIVGKHTGINTSGVFAEFDYVMRYNRILKE